MYKLWSIVGFLLLVVGGVFFYYSTRLLTDVPAVSSPAASVEERLWEVPDFELVDSNGQSFSRANLDGKVWLAAFIFTRCPGPCPMITRRMTEVQNSLTPGEDAHLVSFTIDPEYDQPPVLAAYAQHWGADTSRWHFLTSARPESMQELADAFKVAAVREDDSEGSEIPNITHGTNLLLVGPDGFVRGIYSSEDPAVSDQIVEGIRRLVREG